MLSNLMIKSNVIEKFDDKTLVRLSALDLYSISERNPNRGHFFDERTRYLCLGLLPTKKQNDEWTQRLFWGYRSVSLRDEKRKIKWLEELAEELIPRWLDKQATLDLEVSKEWLWFCAQLEVSNKWMTLSRQIGQEVRAYLKEKERFDDQTINRLIEELG